MASLNRVLIMGNLGQDPELRYTQNQTPVVTLNIATTESWNRDGQKQEQTEWHRVIVWNKQAENCAKYLAKGRSVFVEGKLQTRSWDDKNGQKRYTTEIVASSVQFLPNSAGAQSRAPQASYGQSSSNSTAAAPDTNYFPQAQSAPSSQSTDNSNKQAMDALDDIPF